MEDPILSSFTTGSDSSDITELDKLKEEVERLKEIVESVSRKSKKRSREDLDDDDVNSRNVSSKTNSSSIDLSLIDSSGDSSGDSSVDSIENDEEKEDESQKKKEFTCGLCCRNHWLKSCYLYNRMKNDFKEEIEDFLLEYNSDNRIKKKLFHTSLLQYFRILMPKYPKEFKNHKNDVSKYTSFKIPDGIFNKKHLFKIIKNIKFSNPCFIPCYICKSFEHLSRYCIYIPKLEEKYPNKTRNFKKEMQKKGLTYTEERNRYNVFIRNLLVKDLTPKPDST
jgi:hypothetical protein